MGSTGRNFVPAMADGRNIPERDAEIDPHFTAEYEEDVYRHWNSIAIFGTIQLVTTLVLGATAGFTQANLNLDALFYLGIGVIIFGCFVAFAAYPYAIGWVALAGAAMVAESFLLSALSSNWTLLVLGGFLAAGALALGLGAWRAAVNWRELRREDDAPDPPSPVSRIQG
jgi:hypothetical protein